nr:hypothetical protein [Tanacetum cinerariifolium]
LGALTREVTGSLIGELTGSDVKIGDSVDNRRLDVFVASVVSRMHRVLSRLGLTFYYWRRISSRNRGSWICSSSSSCNTLQILF